MCGKAPPFRSADIFFFRQGCALPSVRHSLKWIKIDLSESQRLSADQAAQPQLLKLSVSSHFGFVPGILAGVALGFTTGGGGFAVGVSVFGVDRDLT
jgi:hypothetical protein